MLLERLEEASVLLENVAEEVRLRSTSGRRFESGEAILTAAEVLGSLKAGVLVAIRDEEHEIVGLLALDDQRARDAISPEEIGLVEQLATQIGVVIENSRSYQQMKE